MRRLDALTRSGLLRHQMQERLTHVCFSVVQLLGADVSQLNLLTETQQLHVAEWPKVEPPRPPMRVQDSGCREVVEKNTTINVPDTREHPVLCRLPWTETWQGYLATPVRYSGHAIGSLCALTREPRQWTSHDEMALQTMAGLVSSSLSADLDGPALP